MNYDDIQQGMKVRVIRPGYPPEIGVVVDKGTNMNIGCRRCGQGKPHGYARVDMGGSIIRVGAQFIEKI